jgi:acetylornithine deacetylase/succinyl-diaminopimelate desuccinylase-like protein
VQLRTAANEAIAFARRSDVRRRWVNQLAALVAIPSVSSDAAHRQDIHDAASLLRRHCDAIGLDATVFPGEQGGAPSVFAERRSRTRGPTILFYGHYDVQPPGARSVWRTPPFKPIVELGRIIGRGTSDDKGQLFAHLAAIESWIACAQTLPVGVKVWLEGEEELGSPTLPFVLDRHLARLRADGVVISDTEMMAEDVPAIVYGLRGVVSSDVHVAGPRRSVHAGRYGGAIRNPLEVAAAIITSLHRSDGRVAIDGFYDDVLPASPRERSALRASMVGDRALKAEFDVRPFGEPHFSTAERIAIRPALIVTAVWAGDAAEKAGIPRRAGARVTARIVPDQNPIRVAELIRAHVQDVTPPDVRVRVTTRAASPPVLLPTQHPIIDAAARAVTRVWGKPPPFVRSGGSIPVAGQFHSRLHAPVVLLGFGKPVDGAHAPNESLALDRFFSAIETIIQFIAECAA